MELKRYKIRNLVRKEEAKMVRWAAKKFTPLVSSVFACKRAGSGGRTWLLETKALRERFSMHYELLALSDER
jgi:hypothetical protein